MAHDHLRCAAPVNLARERPFQLGDVTVEPSARRVLRDGTARVVEPRVMQVLVALAHARDAVVSREELIERCWEGRIVGEHAINRVISRIRQAAAAFDGAFEVETVTKVGYRLIAAKDGAPALPPPPSPSAAERPPDRRGVIAGAALAGAGAIGLGSHQVWKAVAGPDPEALAYYRKGVEAQRQGLRDQNAQAVVHFRNAVAADPEFAAAWGALALAYRHQLETGTGGDLETVAEWSRSAAQRALALDRSNADAETALILIRPYFRNWAVLERDCRAALRRHPDAWLLHANLGRVLAETGRNAEAVAAFQQAIGKDPFLPVAWARLGAAQWAAGRLHEAEATLREARRRWPSHPGVWSGWFSFLAYTGAPAAALALAADPEQRPAGMPERTFASLAAVARALQTRAAADVESAMRFVAGGPAEAAVWFHASVGALDAAFARLDGYYGGSGPGGPLHPLSRRYTDFLFAAPAERVRSNPRFDALLESVGLQAYWRRTGSRPDYRA